jgi:N6-adenosine-specific RNA methylase IME4
MNLNIIKTYEDTTQSLDLVVTADKKFHDVTKIFPLMTEEEFDDLKKDIEKNGLKESIWIDNFGNIIDGRNRDRACKEIGLEPQYRVYDGDSSILDFVISMNFKRRNLTPTQKAFVAANIETYLAKEAKDRQREAGRNYGENHPKHSAVQKNQYSFVSEEQELVEIIPQALPRQHPDDGKSRTLAAKCLGVNTHYVSDAKRITFMAPDVADSARSGKLDMPDAVKISKLDEPLRKEILKSVEQGSKPTKAIQETTRQKAKAELESVEAMATKAVLGVYDVIVVDPPWPMQKIELDVTPTQVALDYPTMSLEEISQMSIPFAEDCHVWVWTTQKFLPHAFNIIKSWGLKYVCTFVWHKNGGYQPIGLPQYNCEFILYCRKGSPKFVDFKDFPTCFNAPRTGHSKKPEAFYELVRRVTAGRRLDMFNRREIQEFDSWGKEAA